MLIDFSGRLGRYIRENYKYFIIPLGFLFLVWLVFLVISLYEAPVTFERKPPVFYSKEETARTLSELAEKGYTSNIGPYYEQVRGRLLARQLGIVKYKLKAKDNLWDIAKRYKIKIDTIVGANPYLKSLTKTKLGQELIIVSKKGVLHKVKDKEDLKSIAGLYGAGMENIKTDNDLSNGTAEGDYLFIANVAPIDLTEEMKSQYALTKLFGSPILAGATKYTSRMKIRSDPFTGAQSFHDGLDIRANPSDKICAVASGTVMTAGEFGAAGLMIKIKHDNGYTTLYGHNSKLYVGYGQRVKKGQVIAQAGSTGRSTGTHLHFTVWDKNNKLVDPSLMLMTTR